MFRGEKAALDTGAGGLLTPWPVAPASSSAGLGLGVGLSVGGSLVLFPTPNPLQLLSSPGRTVVLEGREIVILSWSLASDQGTWMAVLGGLTRRAAHVMNYRRCGGAGLPEAGAVEPSEETGSRLGMPGMELAS